MSLRLSFKVSLPLAVLALFVAFAAWPGVMTPAVEATVSNVTTNDSIAEHGQNVNITVTGTDDSGTLTVVNGAANEVFTLVSCASSGDCTPQTGGNNTGSFTLNTDIIAGSTYTLVLQMTLDCTSGEEITVVADDDDNSDSVAVLCIDDDDDPEVVIEKEAGDDNDDFNFDWDADGTCAVVTPDGVDVGGSGSFDLEDEEEASFFCDEDVDSLVVDEDDDGSFTGISGCSEGSEGVDDISGSSIDFDLSELEAGDTVSCTFVNTGFEATATAVAGPVTSVQVLAANIASCGGTTAVQVTVRNAQGGPAPAGTSVTATSSAGGTFQPSATLTANFPFSFATFLYQAPPTFSGIATITVRTNNNVVGVANIQVVCGVTAPAPVAPTAGPLRPPSAGDGGLLGSSNGGAGFGAYLPSTLALAFAGLLISATLASRRFGLTAAATIATQDPAPQPSPAAKRSYASLVSLLLVGVALFMRRHGR